MGEETAARYRAQWLGAETQVLLEERCDGLWRGYTPEYIPVTVPDCPRCGQGVLLQVKLTGEAGEFMTGEIL